MPHYNSEYQLDSIIVGSHQGWEYTMKSQGYDPKWGYLDYRPAYDVSVFKYVDQILNFRCIRIGI